MNILRKLWALVAVLWFTGCLIVVIMTIASSTFAPGIVAILYVWSTVVLSVVSFGIYGYDKLRAARDKPRIAEKSMHLLALLGGWPGAVVGQQYFRHKTLKVGFRIILTAIAVLHLAAGGAWVWTQQSPSGP